MTPRRSLFLAVPAAAALAGALLATPAAGTDAPPAYQWNLTTTGTTEQFRGLDAVSAKVAWVAGEDGGILKTTDGGASWQDVSPGGRPYGHEFRDVEAWSAQHAVVLAIGTGRASRVYETRNGGKSWSLRFKNKDPNAFYDCMAFSKSGRGLALSDPVDGHFRLARSGDFGHSWKVQSTKGMPKAVDGEFAFAASGTCLVSGPWRNFWFASGGVDKPRIFHSADGGRTWDVSARRCAAARARASTRSTSAPSARASWSGETSSTRPTALTRPRRSPTPPADGAPARIPSSDTGRASRSSPARPTP